VFQEYVVLQGSAKALAGEVAASGDEVERREEPLPDVAVDVAIDNGGGSSDADSEREQPVDGARRLIAEANSIEHSLSHYPKNAHCPVCQRSRMYRKRVRKFRQDPLADRGLLPPVTKCVVQKLGTGKEQGCTFEGIV